ncbi:DMT family transporter [Aestuariivirga sp.]|uniref:DMT family transporter n=1 Tax=Aestuariivirga sp. TaxID=2650926 RepID=UPI0025C36F52|nr:DMT family transporter [Aestuariivirga sp.]MCA3554220.1 DMT family transporter [Aestuariivirga sp.]
MNRPLVLLLITGLAFGCNFPLGKLAVAAGVNPALWAAVICLGAGCAVGVAAWLFEATGGAAPGLYRYAAISSVISNVIPLALTFAAIPHIGSGLAAILVATSPATTAILSMAFRVRPPGPLGLAGIAVGLAGAVTIIIARNAGFGATESRWLLLAALIPVFLGAGNVYRTVAWPKGAGPMRLGAAINLSAVLPLLVLAGLGGGLNLAPLSSIPGLVAAQLAASTIMYLTFFRLQAVGGPTYLSQIGYVAAAVGVAVGVWFLGERYPPLVWAGIAVVALGIGLTTLAQARAPRSLSGKQPRRRG